MHLPNSARLPTARRELQVAAESRGLDSPTPRQNPPKPLRAQWQWPNQVRLTCFP